MSQFLPTTLEEGKEKGIDVFDFVLVSGDAYVDHPSFGVAIISRLLEANGYTVGIIPQPDWKDPNSVTVLGTPRLAFLVTGGNIDSMVNHYSVAKRRRDHDALHRAEKSDIVRTGPQLFMVILFAKPIKKHRSLSVVLKQVFED